jgi:pimeloyl-ACP methyl ester carboxylesterase
MPFLTVDGCPVRYDRTGRGPTVVLLHGGGTDSAHLSWAPVTPRLVAHADVIAPDLPGGSPLGGRQRPSQVMRRRATDSLRRRAHPHRLPGSSARRRARHRAARRRPSRGARIPHGVYVEVPEAGHWLPRDAPEAVAGHLLEMLTLTAGPRTS